MARNKLLTWFGIGAIIFGIGAVIFGTMGGVYAYGTSMEQSIIVNEDADFFMAREGEPMWTPFDMLGQANAIEHHVLERTDGQYYAEMDRDNPARASWISATTLISALQLGALAWALIVFVVMFGFISVGTGFVFLSLRE